MKRATIPLFLTALAGCASDRIVPVALPETPPPCPICQTLKAQILAPECYQAADSVPEPYSGPPPDNPGAALRISDAENVELRAYAEALRLANNACVASALVAAEGH